SSRRRHTRFSRDWSSDVCSFDLTFQNIRLFREMSVVENLLVAQHMRVNRNLLAGVLNTPAYRRSENDALDRAFYWLEVVDLVDRDRKSVMEGRGGGAGGWWIELT